MDKINDLIAENWKEYEKQNLQFWTVWDFEERDPYNWTRETIRGNSPVEVVRQCLLRWTKENDLVLDPFVGSGTTLVVCAKLKRRGIGFEINPKIYKLAKINIENLNYELFEANYIEEWIKKQILINDSALNILNYVDKESVDFVFAHPPYWNLIKYSEIYGNVEGDLSMLTFEEFLENMKKVFEIIHKVLKNNSYLSVLIGEAFLKGGKVIPLDYYITDIALKTGFEFVVKIIKVTRNATSRKNQINIMKYRSVKYNFFICNHDYLIVFQKRK